MTQLTLRTNEKELNRIDSGDQRFVIRTDKLPVFGGDVIGFQNYKGGKPAYHKGNDKLYVVTFIADSGEMPINEGCRFIAFKDVL